MITKAQVKLVRSLQQKKFRDETGYFVAEGGKCIEELKKSFELVLYCDSSNATPTEIEQMSSMRTPQGAIAVFKQGRREKVEGSKALSGADGLILALDGVQDPGNLGTIIRTADWFGVRDIVCSLDTADCYNPKVVQATMGALARVRVHYLDLAKWLAGCRLQIAGCREIYGTLLDGQDMYEVLKNHLSPATCNLPPVIVMGNEGNGISEDVRKLVTCPVRIPSYPKDAETSESLNVAIATAIILAEFRRSR